MLVQRMFAAARQQLKDAAVEVVSNETRFDCAYNAIRCIADIGLLLNGYRTTTSRPGHHQTAVQALAHTLGIDAQTVRVLDSLRRMRSGSNYDGDPITDKALAECIKQATALFAKLNEVMGPGTSRAS